MLWLMTPLPSVYSEAELDAEILDVRAILPPDPDAVCKDTVLTVTAPPTVSVPVAVSDKLLADDAKSVIALLLEIVALPVVAMDKDEASVDNVPKLPDPAPEPVEPRLLDRMSDGVVIVFPAPCVMLPEPLVWIAADTVAVTFEFNCTLPLEP